jgi:hypothetical protein
MAAGAAARFYLLPMLRLDFEIQYDSQWISWGSISVCKE